MLTAIHPAYIPLYENRDKFIILITGGRGSGKSFEVSRFVERLTFEVGHKILFTRYTMTSADKSVIPEVTDKIERDGLVEEFDVTKTRIINKRTHSEIIFMGIKTSSGNQTAKLKSIQGLTTFVCDEAEEWRSADEFERLVLSIRQKGIQNRVIIVMNPSDTGHFVYEKYIKDTHELRMIEGVPVQISTHPNVLHIHTSYLDNQDYLSEEMLRELSTLREQNPKRYAHIVLGQWVDAQEGAVYKEYEIVDEIPPYAKKHGIGLDFGYTNDPSCAVHCAVHEGRLYVDELFYQTGMLSSDLTRALSGSEYPVIADCADPRLIDEIAIGGVPILPVRKGAGSLLAGIQHIQGLRLCVTRRSRNILHELRTYVWEADGKGGYLNLPRDENNHAMDAIRYYVLHSLLGWGETAQSERASTSYWAGSL